MFLRRLFGTLTLSTLIATPAFSAEGSPRPEDLLSAKTVSVLPVLTSGPRAAAYQRLEATLASASGRSLVDPTTMVSIDESAGFGFAGASTDSDVMILRLGFLVGAVGSTDAERLDKVIKTYDKARESLAPLMPEVIAAADKVIAAAREGRIDTSALASAMRLAEEGIAKGPARAHGYFAAGLWIGMSGEVAAAPYADSGFTAMAFPLAIMLEQDAEFGGSDLVLAGELKKIANMLVAGTVDAKAYGAAIMAAMSVKADR